MQGAQRAQVNRTRMPSGVRNPARESPVQADGQPDQKADPKQDQSGAETKTDVAAQPEQATGLQQGGQALIDGIGQILKDPAWNTHPLLHLFRDPTWVQTDPAQAPQVAQDLWHATQWWGHAVNALIDPNAIHASAQNIEHDNSVGGQIAQNLFAIHDDPVSEFVWN